MYTTDQIARASHLQGETIRSYFNRAPDFKLGNTDGRAKTYTESESIAVLIAVEILRHRLGRPHEVLPNAAIAARNSDGSTLWAYRDDMDDLQIVASRPDRATAVMIPIALLVGRLKSASGRKRIARQTR